MDSLTGAEAAERVCEQVCSKLLQGGAQLAQVCASFPSSVHGDKLSTLLHMTGEVSWL